MNLFLLGWTPSGGIELDRAHRKVLDVVARVPALEGGKLTSWRSPSGSAALVAVDNSPEPATARYVHVEESRMALFAGRPILWTDEFEADGRRPLDARSFLEPEAGWAPALDGRFVVARYDERERALDLCTDPVGSYPVYGAAVGGVRWFSNNARLLCELTGDRSLRPHVLAAFLACGASLTGEPIWTAVERLERASLHRFRAASGVERIDLLPEATIASYFEERFEPEAAARTTVAAVRALADWPGRSNSVPVTGGRDSRIVLAAALAAGVEFEARTVAFPHLPGYPETEDVRIARVLCEDARIPHVKVELEEPVTLSAVASALAAVSPGTVSLGDILGETRLVSPPRGQLELRHSGHGGELARVPAFWPVAAATPRGLTRSFYRFLANTWPPVIVSRAGRAEVTGFLRRWIDDHAGLVRDPADLADLLYLLQRLQCWSGANHSVFEYSADTTSPLWSSRLLRQQFAVPRRQRGSEIFSLKVLEALRPSFAHIDFDSVPAGWSKSRSPRVMQDKRLQLIAGKVSLELRRRHEARREPKATLQQVDPFPTALRLLRTSVADQPEHGAWQVLDRRRVARLLRRDPVDLDLRRRRQAWWLATVFLATGDGPARVPEHRRRVLWRDLNERAAGAAHPDQAPIPTPPASAAS